MKHQFLTDHFVFCCMTQEEIDEIKLAMEHGEYRAVHSRLNHFSTEKHGYRCTICGRLHPYLRIANKGQLINPHDYSKPLGELQKFKKSAALFFNDHYYATNKNKLLKLPAAPEQNIQDAEEIALSGKAVYFALSTDEKYLATDKNSRNITIIDTETNETLTLKKKKDISGNFIFTEDRKLLYYCEESIWCWDYLHGEDTTIWSVPEEWKICRERNIRIRVTCHNAINNSRKGSCLFQIQPANDTFIVAIKNGSLEQITQLPIAPISCKLTYHEHLDRYTMTTDTGIAVYDGDFHMLDTILPPRLIRISNGGGFFPVSVHENKEPQRTYISPDGKWILMDYFTAAILMRRDDQEIKFCLFSYTGKTTKQWGFTDHNHFAYSWGDTTYIHEIKE